MLGGGAWAERIPSIFGSGWRGTSPRAGRGGGGSPLRGQRQHGGFGSRRARRAARWRRAGEAAARTGQARDLPRLSVELVEAVPDITMPELARALEAEQGEGRSLVDLARADPPA